MAPASTTASTERCGPKRSVIYLAIEFTEPESSMSLPNKAPRRKIGKNCMTNCAALAMKVCVQCASSGWPANAAERFAAGGAHRRVLPPREASQMRSPSPMRMPMSPMRSHPLEQNVDIEGRAFFQIHAVIVEKRLRGFSSLVAQERKELPFRIEL